MKDYSINISVEKNSNISSETAETVNFHFSHYKSMGTINCHSNHDMVTASCAIKPSIQKQKPRKVPLLGKTDWPKFKSLMRDYQQKFLLNHFNRSVEELWSDFVTTIDTYASKCVPTKTIRDKTSLPWITKDIRRQIRRKDD